MPTLSEQVITDLYRLNNLEIRLILKGFEALVILGQLQLALRHPGQSEQLSTTTTEIARRIQSHLALTSSLNEMMERGWDPKHDIPTT